MPKLMVKKGPQQRPSIAPLNFPACLHNFFYAYAAKEDTEFIATKAKWASLFDTGLPQYLSKFLQALVTRLMPKRIIDLFKIIQIQNG